MACHSSAQRLHDRIQALCCSALTFQTLDLEALAVPQASMMQCLLSTAFAVEEADTSELKGEAEITAAFWHPAAIPCKAKQSKMRYQPESCL